MLLACDGVAVGPGRAEGAAGVGPPTFGQYFCVQ